MVSRFGKSPPWWDRELDAAGRPIRADARAAALEIWEKIHKQAESILRDSSEAAALMEQSVAQISRYLDRTGATLCPQNAARLLMASFTRALRRRATKLRRIELVGDMNDFREPRSTAHCGTTQDCRLDAEKACRHLSERSRTMHRLRSEGFDWEEIAGMMRTTATAARAEFSRDLKRAKRKLQPSPRARKST